MKFAMEDGRVYTSYQPSCSLNYDIQKKYNIENNSHEYRYYLQRNAEKLIGDFRTKGDCVLCPICKASLSYKPKSSQG